MNEGGIMVELTAKIVAAYVARNTVPVADLPTLISTVQTALVDAGKPAEAAAVPEELKPAVPVKKSVTPEYIICLEDGKKLKMLKRAKWGLPADYPMVAPNYAKARSDLALKLGLGKRAG